MKTNKRIKIAVLAGDGIGPEIMNQALKVLMAVSHKYSFELDINAALIGGAAIDALGHPLPAETANCCLQADAVLLGCIGGPKWDNLPPEKRPEIGGLLGLRRMLNLYANIRPIVFYPELANISPLNPRLVEKKIDLVTVRELAEGVYFSQPRGLNDNEGFDTMRYSRQAVERIARIAFQMAAKRGKKVTSVDKANVLHSSMLWRQVVKEIAREYPEIELKHLYIDNAAMQLILNPHQFDVILTSNLFGDILSDESAALCGSLGLLPSASLGDKIHLFEPAGGSAPDIAGKGIANPIAQILSAAMMLAYSFNLEEAAADICRAVESVIKQGHRTADIAGPKIRPLDTETMGDLICRSITC